MTITTFRSLAKHLLRKYVAEKLEAFLFSVILIPHPWATLTPEHGSKVHTFKPGTHMVHSQICVYFAKVLLP